MFYSSACILWYSYFFCVAAIDAFNNLGICKLPKCKEIRKLEIRRLKQNEAKSKIRDSYLKEENEKIEKNNRNAVLGLFSSRFLRWVRRASFKKDILWIKRKLMNSLN